MGRRAPRRTELGDDPSGLAGWLYADLLLGFAVIFLGSLTFMVVRSSSEDDVAGAGTTQPPVETTTTSTTTTTTGVTTTIARPDRARRRERPHPSTTTTTTLPPQPCALDREQLEQIDVSWIGDDAQLAQDVKAAIVEGLNNRAHPLPPNSRIGMALVFANGSTDETARVRAAEMAERLKRVLPKRFGLAASRPFFDHSLPDDRFDLDLFALTGSC